VESGYPKKIMLKQKARAECRSNHDSPRSTVTPTKIAERAYPTNYSFPLEARERDCQRSLPPLKKGVVG
jgi:hypothetical protein